jgi:hypothetical protein
MKQPSLLKNNCHALNKSPKITQHLTLTTLNVILIKEPKV